MAIGNINKLSIKRPISVSTLIFFLNKLYMLHKKATENPIQGNELRLKKRQIVDIITKLIEIILFLFNFSLKKRKPKKTLIIGKIKYPKLASIILFVATAYIHIDQFANIKMLVINIKILDD